MTLLIPKPLSPASPAPAAPVALTAEMWVLGAPVLYYLRPAVVVTRKPLRAGGGAFYSPLLGRFISADTIVPQPGDPQSLNCYARTRRLHEAFSFAPARVSDDE